MKCSLLALVLLCGSCRTVETRSQPSTPPADVRIGARTRAWEVQRGPERLGRVVLFQERGLVRDSVYVVRNVWNQDLGLIDGLGRAYRYLPHLDEPVWVGSGTITLGAERILGVAECTLVELAGELDHASAEATLAASEAVDHEALEPAARPSNAPRADVGLPQSR